MFALAGERQDLVVAQRTKATLKPEASCCPSSYSTKISRVCTQRVPWRGVVLSLFECSLSLTLSKSPLVRWRFHPPRQTP